MADSSLPVAADTPATTPPAATNGMSSGIRVIVNNLPYAVADDDFRAFADGLVSEIVSCQVKTLETSKGTRSAGYGFIVFATTEAAQNAIGALDSKDIQGRQVRAKLARDEEDGGERRGPRRPYNYRGRFKRDGRRGNRTVPGEATDADAATASDGKPVSDDKENRPEEQSAKPRRFRSKRKYYAKAKASQGEEGAPAESGGEASAPGAATTPKKFRRIPRPRRAEGEEPQGIPSTTTLFVANLPFSLDDEGLASLFTEAGFAVKSARVVRRRWGRPRKSKGYGFVDVGSEEEQKKAMAALEGKVLADRQIAVKVAVDPAKHEGDETAEAAAGSTQ